MKPEPVQLVLTFERWVRLSEDRGDPMYRYEVSSSGGVQSRAGRGGLRGALTQDARPLKSRLVNGRANVPLSGFKPFRVCGLNSHPKNDVGGDQHVVAVSVHRLVCWAFHGPPPVGREEVDHIDGDRENNTASNLRWASRDENRRNRSWVGHRRVTSRHAGKRDRVREYLASHPDVTVRAAAVALGVSHRLVWNVRQGLR